MWSIDRLERVPTGADAGWFKWWLRDSEGAEIFVVVKISGTDLSTAIECLPDHVAAAVESLGRSEVERFLDWPIPPRTVDVRRHRSEPLIEIREALPTFA